jgi:hypothetical protein
MKKIIITIITAAAITGIYSCEKKFTTIGDTKTAADGLAYVQVFSSTVNAARNYAYVDGVPVTGTAFAYGGLYPATAYSFGVAAGPHAVIIKDTLAATTQAPLTFNETFEAGKKYTIFTYDTITAAKKLTVTDNIVIPTDTTSRVRFANFIYNTAAVPAVDVFSWKRNANIFTNIPVAQVTDFIPYEASAVADTLYVRETGTAVLLNKVAVTFTKQRFYTAVLRGSYKGTKVVSTFISY